jgi:hypothetical protein
MLLALLAAFSRGQIIFAIAFSVVFIGVLIWSYRKDKNLTRNYYKKSGFWVLLGIIAFLVLYRYLVKVLH